ncbi:hypothetical protein [Cohnella thailandensis]|uniref:Uncharacterized protein n=1 Tax=Cohnella thailandensis TaxID=557557 RepID=A0A841SZW3_9BACL|nr:hypothetical protein [Cohnella thailandensis]MBB6634331.1 hypothetical protein [Cohnella thailandensis]MBP1972170.1 hypothetical protein [Cohnella thailandensis]
MNYNWVGEGNGHGEGEGTYLSGFVNTSNEYFLRARADVDTFEGGYNAYRISYAAIFTAAGVALGTAPIIGPGGVASVSVAAAVAAAYAIAAFGDAKDDLEAAFDTIDMMTDW